MFPKTFLFSFYLFISLNGFCQQSEELRNDFIEQTERPTPIFSKKEEVQKTDSPDLDPINRCGDQFFLRDGTTFEGKYIKTTKYSQVVYKKCRDFFGTKRKAYETELEKIVLINGDTLSFHPSKSITIQKEHIEKKQKAKRNIFTGGVTLVLILGLITSVFFGLLIYYFLKLLGFF